MENIWVEAIGFFGMSCCLGAYALNVRGHLAATDGRYLLANVVGGACLVVNSLWHWALPSAIENSIWAGIALLSVCSNWQKKRSDTGG